MTLDDNDVGVLRLVRAARHGKPAECPSQTWIAELADLMRTCAPELRDEHLAVLLLRAGKYLAERASGHGLSGISVTALMYGAAADLAALEIGEQPS